MFSRRHPGASAVPLPQMAIKLRGGLDTARRRHRSSGCSNIAFASSRRSFSRRSSANFLRSCGSVVARVRAPAAATRAHLNFREPIRELLVSQARRFRC
jgi:hypothetical protein